MPRQITINEDAAARVQARRLTKDNQLVQDAVAEINAAVGAYVTQLQALNNAYQTNGQNIVAIANDNSNSTAVRQLAGNMVSILQEQRKMQVEMNGLLKELYDSLKIIYRLQEIE